MECRHPALVGPFHPYRDGIVHHSESLCKGLRRRDHQVLPGTFKRQCPRRPISGKTQLEPKPSAESVNVLRPLETLKPVTGDRVARRTPGLDENRPVLLFLGFVRNSKGHGTLVRSLPSVAAALPRLRLLAADECYKDRQPCEVRLYSPAVRENVHIDARYIPSSLAGACFRVADVEVQPHRSATRSGVARVAYHFGIPAITTDVGGLAAVVPDGKAGLVVPPEDREALPAAFLRRFEQGLGPMLAEGARYGWQKNSRDNPREAQESLA